MATSAKWWRSPRFFISLLVRILAPIVIILGLFFYFADYVRDVNFPVPTERHRLEHQKLISEELGTPIRLEKVLWIDGDRSESILIVDADSAESVVRSSKRGEVVNETEVFSDGRYHKFIEMNGRVICFTSPERGTTDEILARARSFDRLSSLYSTQSPNYR